MKRFTETTKWSKPWFRKLPPAIKLLWFYLLDTCDNSGVIDLDFELASFCIGNEVDSVELLNKQLYLMKCGKWFIKDFIKYQCGELSENCKPHKQIIDLLKKHGLYKGYTKGIDTLQEKEKDKEQDKDKDKDKIKAIINHLNHKTGKSFKYDSIDAIKHITARLKDGYKLEDFYKVIDTKIKDPYFIEKDYMRPKTLFGNNFDSYLNEKPKTKKPSGVVASKTEMDEDFEEFNTKLKKNEEVKDG